MSAFEAEEHEEEHEPATKHGKLAMISDTTEFKPWQVEGVRLMARMQSSLLCDDMGLGKAHAAHEPVLTPAGWKPMGDIVAGDLVIGQGGKSTEVIGVFPQGEQEIARVTFNDGTWSECTWDHLWSVQHVRNDRRARHPDTVDGRWRTMTTREILTAGVEDASGNRTWRIPLVEAVEFEPVGRLAVDPYTLGVWLGNGSKWSIATHADDADTVGSVCTRGRLVASANGKAWVGSLPRAAVEGLRNLGIFNLRSWEKVVPGQYLVASPEERLALLQGLMDTDGHAITAGGGTEFSSTSENLVDAVTEIAQSLGGVARKHGPRVTQFDSPDGKKNGRPSWRVNVKLPVSMEPFRSPRKLFSWTRPTKYPARRIIASIEPTGRVEPAVCIRVAAADHLYVTRSYIVTHNTLTALTVAAVDFEMALAKRVLVIAPASLKINWAEEIEKHTNFTFMVLGAEKTGPDEWKERNSPKQRAAQLEAFASGDTQILVVGVEQVVSLTEWTKDKKDRPVAVSNELSDLHFDIAVVDEAHIIKNPTSQRTKAVHVVEAPRWILCTGSPILNEGVDLWGLLHRAYPHDYPNYFSFVHRYAVYGGYKDKQIVGVKNPNELRDKLASVMIRRLAVDVLDAKEPLYIQVPVDLHPEQRKLYDQAEDELKISAPDDGFVDLFMENSLTRDLRLAQICATTATLPGFEDFSFKLDRVVSDVQELAANGLRTIVFTQFRPVLACLERRLSNPARGLDPVPTWQIHGDVPKTDRVGVINKWTKASEVGAMLSMLQVGGVGLNMGAARHVLFVDKLFAPKLNEQAVARTGGIRGLGHTKPVQVREYLARGTLESRKEAILRRKTKTFKTLVETSDWRKALYEALNEKDDA